MSEIEDLRRRVGQLEVALAMTERRLDETESGLMVCAEMALIALRYGEDQDDQARSDDLATFQKLITRLRNIVVHEKVDT